jgi:hypothetical protein
MARRAAHLPVFSVLSDGATVLSEWQKFFAVRLPLAALVLAVAAEVPAFLLSGVTLHRHNVDDLASAVFHDRHPYKVVLLGDSITHNVAHKFRIGDADEVADLTTHARAGLPSSLFLLKRYLESGHRPTHVVLAASRDVFVLPMEKDTFDLYVTSVFRLPYEREFLQKFYPNYVDYRWRPAALTMDTKVAEPLFSLLRHPREEIWAAPDVPAPNPPLEQFADEKVDPVMFRDRVDMSFDVRPEARAALTEICKLGQRYPFQLHLIWAPTEPQLWSTLEANGSLQRVNRQLSELFAENHTQVSLDDSSSQRRYPYFDQGLIHIKGSGWEQVYADQLSSYIHGFDVARIQPITAAK